jgi:phosphonate transport system substrate-binding protein
MTTKKKFLSLCLFLLIVMGSRPAVRAEDPLQGNIEQRGLHLALVPEKNVFEQRRRYRYITDYLAGKLGFKVHIDIMSNYGQICEAFLNGTTDTGFFGSFSYVLTHARAGIEPVARPVWPDGSSTYRSYIFVRKDSGIRTLEDMKGKTLVLVDKATTAGYIFPLFYFRSFGIKNLSDIFAKIYFAGSHDVAAWAVYTGEADVGGAKNHIYNALGDEYPDFREQMITLVESPAVPSNCFAVRKDLSPALKLRLKGLLLNLDKTEEGQKILADFGATKFIPTVNEEYHSLYQMIDQLDIDLATYPY